MPQQTQTSIQAIPAFNDNYIWAIVAPQTQAGNTNQTQKQACWLVDPGDAAPALAFMQAAQLQLAGILLTHHHGDHDGGIPALQAKFPNTPVYGSHSSQSAHCTEGLQEGDTFSVGGHSFKVIAVPGHTLDHIAFYSPSLEALFCGDTLFAGGCGRLFEGSPEQMHQSLGKLSALPANTQVYCAHEYTLSNLKFAIQVEPENTDLQQRLHTVESARANDQATVPSLMATELATNPFLRSHVDAVQRAASNYSQRQQEASPTSDCEVFATIRRWKDHA